MHPNVYRFGRGNFQETMKITRKLDPQAIDWSGFRYMVFDVPTSKGTYSERYALLRTYLKYPLS